MKRVAVLAAACALIAAPALAQDKQPASPMPTTSGNTQNPTAQPGMDPKVNTGAAANTGAAPAASMSTAEFVKKVAISDMFEIESSKLAQQKADAESKTFAAKMVTDHSKTSAELKSMVQSGKVKAELPTALDDDHKKKLDELQSASGQQFDDKYDQMQKHAHHEAVMLFERYAQNGDNAELKQWAAKTLPALKEHHSMAEKLK
jgi:putative membrane protein